MTIENSDAALKQSFLAMSSFLELTAQIPP